MSVCFSFALKHIFVAASRCILNFCTPQIVPPPPVMRPYTRALHPLIGYSVTPPPSPALPRVTCDQHHYVSLYNCYILTYVENRYILSLKPCLFWCIKKNRICEGLLYNAVASDVCITLVLSFVNGKDTKSSF